MPEEDYFTIHEAARVIGVTRQYVWRWVRDKVIPARRFGKVWLILPGDVRAMVERRAKDKEKENA